MLQNVQWIVFHTYSSSVTQKYTHLFNYTLNPIAYFVNIDIAVYFYNKPSSWHEVSKATVPHVKNFYHFEIDTYSFSLMTLLR